MIELDYANIVNKKCSQNFVECCEYLIAGFDIVFSLHKLPVTFLILNHITKLFNQHLTILI